jgi:hypothetical protein
MAMDRTVNDLRDAIEQVLEDDSNRVSFGKILKRPRAGLYPNDHREAMIDDDGSLRATVIFSPRIREFEDEARWLVWGLNSFEIAHYLAFNEEKNSEKDFNAELEHLRSALRMNATVFGVPARPETQRTIETVDPTIVIVGDVLCHQGIVPFTIETKDGL